MIVLLSTEKRLLAHEQCEKYTNIVYLLSYLSIFLKPSFFKRIQIIFTECSK